MDGQQQRTDAWHNIMLRWDTGTGDELYTEQLSIARDMCEADHRACVIVEASLHESDSPVSDKTMARE